MSLANVKKGDTLTVECCGWRSSDPVTVSSFTVTAAGRKYVTVNNGYSPLRFHRDTGREVTEYSERHRAFVSPEAYAAEMERERLVEQVRDACRSAQFGLMPSDQLRTILRAVKP